MFETCVYCDLFFLLCVNILDNMESRNLMSRPDGYELVESYVPFLIEREREIRRGLRRPSSGLKQYVKAVSQELLVSDYCTRSNPIFKRKSLCKGTLCKGPVGSRVYPDCVANHTRSHNRARLS